MNKVLTWIIIILFILNIYNLIIFSIVITRPRLEYHTYSMRDYKAVFNHICDNLEECENNNIIDVNTLEQKINEYKPYLYIKVDKKFRDSNTLGKSNLMFRVVMMDKANIKDRTSNEKDSIYLYAITLLHEYIHLNNLNRDERYTQFKTFTTLYESDDISLHYLAYKFAFAIFNFQYPYDYDCIYYIIEYFKIFLKFT